MSVLFRPENWKKQSMLIYQWRRTRESRKTIFCTVMRLTKCHLGLLTTQALKRSKFPKAIFLVNLLLWINFTFGNFFSGRWALHSWCIWKKIKIKRIENTHNLEYFLPIFTFFIFYFNNYDPLKYISLNFHKYKSSTIKFQVWITSPKPNKHVLPENAPKPSYPAQPQRKSETHAATVQRWMSTHTVGHPTL